MEPWAVGPFLDEVKRRADVAGYGSTIPNGLRFIPAWKESADRAIAYCQQEEVPVPVWIDFIANCVCRWRREQQVYASMISGPAAIRMFKTWYGEQRERYASVLQGVVKHNDRRTQAERSYIEKLEQRVPRAWEKHKQTVSRFGGPCRDRRIVQLCEWLHGKGRDLPDMIMVPTNWTASSVVKATRCLTELK